MVLTNKDDLKVTGVNKINSLDSKHFDLDTSLGNLRVYGVNLEMSQLDPVNKTIIIKCNKFINKIIKHLKCDHLPSRFTSLSTLIVSDIFCMLSLAA